MVVLKPAKESEFSVIVDWVNDHDSDFIVQWAGLTYQYPLTIEQMINHYSNGINSIESGVFLYMIHSENSNDDRIGTVQLARMNMETRDAVIGRFMMKNEDFRGQGMGRTALEEVVRIAFEQFELERIRLNVFDMNVRAIRCYERVGFTKGRTTENVYTSSKGDTWNNIEMILDKDLWKRSRGGH
jgi:RimJ/RimL family protein N-acetyltransferase